MIARSEIPPASREPRRRLRRPLIFLVCVACLVAGWNIYSHHHRVTSEQRAEWNATGIEDYTMSVDLTCFCPGWSYIVTVRGGDVSRLAVTKSGYLRDGSLPDGLARPETVEDLFDLVDSDADQVTYGQYGVPVSIYVDPGAFSDDQTTYSVTLDVD